MNMTGATPPNEQPPQPQDTERTPAESRRAVVEGAVAAVRRVTMLPEVTLRIVDLIQQDDYTAAQLDKLVSTDPGLCLRILKIVNSAFYGSGTEIRSIRRAIVVLGGAAIKNIALAASLGRMLGDARGNGVSGRDLWRHSVTVAAGSRLAAAASDDGVADEAFLCGLLHDIGFIVEMQWRRHELPEAARRVAAGGGNALEVELELFGADHQDFGQGLCDAWRLPRAIGEVVAHHHEPAKASKDAATLSAIVHVADALARQKDLGFAIDAAARMDGAAVRALRLSPDALQKIAQALPLAAKELQQILS